MTQQEAYRAFNREQARLLRWSWAMKKIDREIDRLRHDLHLRVAKELATTRPGQKVLRAYWGHTPKGWEAACGTDGRLKKLARTIGWENFQWIIEVARAMQNTPESD